MQDHLVKAERIERSLKRCTAADYETIIEGAMLAGTHWFNILLHLAQLMPWDSDAMHAEFLALGERRKVRLLLPDALDALDAIEHLRTIHVRGDMPGGEQAALNALERLTELKNKALREIERSGEAHLIADPAP